MATAKARRGGARPRKPPDPVFVLPLRDGKVSVLIPPGHQAEAYSSCRGAVVIMPADVWTAVATAIGAATQQQH